MANIKFEIHENIGMISEGAKGLEACGWLRPNRFAISPQISLPVQNVAELVQE